mgnify:CR=1 FL=1
MKKMIFLLFFFLTFLSTTKALPLPVDVTAENVILVNLDKDEVIYEKNPDNPIILASLTKIMTAYTVIKNVDNLDRKITITEKDISNLYGFTCAGLEVGDKVSYRDLLYAMMLISGADASQALAIHVSGDIESFNELMNKEAKKLGLRHSNFADSYGGDDNNISTAREVSHLLKEALENETFKKIFSTNYYTLSNGLQVVNYTASLATFHGYDSSIITGNKSGYTPEAGLLLASTTTINDNNYLLVVCKSKENIYLSQHVIDTYKIYDYLNQVTFKERVILKKGTIIKRIEAEDSTISEYIAIADKDITAFLSDSDYEKIRYEYHVANLITPKNKIDDNLGYVDILVDNEIIDTYHIYLKDEVFSYQKESKIIMIIIIGLIFFIIILLCTNMMNFERKRF